MVKNLFLAAGMVLLNVTTFAQSPNVAMSTLRQVADSMLRGSTDSMRMSSSEKLSSIFKSWLQKPESFATNLDSIKSISTITSPDGKIRFYQWAFQVLETSSYQLKGFLQVYNSKTKTVDFFELTDGGIAKSDACCQSLTTEKYFPAIYYTIIPIKLTKKNVSYTLLGWRGNDQRSSYKLIDVLSFEKNRPVFGKRIFTAPDNMMPLNTKAAKSFRIIFEYNATAVMSLKYYKKGNRIVFDHLAPAQSYQKGNEQYYGPDMSYDALVWKKGKWNGKPMVDMRNNNSSEGKKIKPIKDSELKK
jgi:hypothetical protein